MDPHTEPSTVYVGAWVQSYLLPEKVCALHTDSLRRGQSMIIPKMVLQSKGCGPLLIGTIYLSEGQG